MPFARCVTLKKTQSCMISPPHEQPTLSEPGPFSSSPVAAGNRFWQMAIVLFLLTAFVEISRILDLVTARGIFVLLILLAVSLLASRRALVFWKCGAGRVLPSVVAWFLLAYFTSQHNRLSTAYMVSVLEGALLFVAGCGLLASVSDFKKMFRVLTAAAMILCVLGVVWSGRVNGRFALRGGPYADPNYFAMALLALAPIVWVSFAAKPLWLRICGTLATALPLLLTLGTASRGAFVAIFVMLIVLFFLSSLKTRIVMGSAAVLALVVLLAFLPESLRARLASAARISSLGGDQTVQTADSVSVDSRETMLMTSINVTLAYPLLGVGPGNFGPTIVEFGKLQGQNWIDLNTHNSYTQVSAETGFPGLLLFLLLIALSLKSLISVLRKTSQTGEHPDPELHRLAAGLLVSLAATCACMFFLSEGYGMLNFLWFGLANGSRLLVPADPEDEEELVEIDPLQAS